MAKWFEGSIEIDSSIDQLKSSFEDLGNHYVGVVSLMPGITSVELVDQGPDFVIIKTNEGLMKRNNISKTIEADRVTLEFDEEYQAGSMAAFKSHYYTEFIQRDAGVEHRTVISDIEAPGLLGFFYKAFGKSSIGNAVLKSNASYFEDNH